MIQTIRLGQGNYLTDKKTGETLERYNPDNKDVELTIKLEDSILKVDGSKIQDCYGGITIVQHNNNRYIIDDGFQNTLIKCGYIVYKDYDTKHIIDKNEGLSVRDSILTSVSKIVNTIEDCEVTTDDENQIMISIGDESDHYSYTIRFTTVNFIVNKNHIRKDNDLCFYPFDKNMDKFGTIYVSVFAQKNFKKFNEPDKYSVPDNIIRKIIMELGCDYHYISLPVRGRVLYQPGL